MIEIGVLKIRKSSLVSFSLGLFGVMLMFILQSLNFHPGNIIKPLVESKEIKSVQNEVSRRLNQIKNDFKVNQKKTIIPQAHSAGEYEKAKAYVTVDYETGEVIAEKNLTKILSIASITKVMSAVVALDLAAPEELFEVTERASKIIPTKIGVVAGQKMTVEELLLASLLTSANDAVQVLSDGIDAKYGEGTFVLAMNEKAELLGMTDTHFTNPQGFDNKGHYSTVSDVAVLVHYALDNYPLIAEIVKKDYEFLAQDSNHKQFDLYNWNGLLGVYPETIGMKIGNTGRAGYTTSVVANREGKKIIAIVLGAPGVKERDLWTAELLDLSYLETKKLPPVEVTEERLLSKYDTWEYWN
jgi:D-alanyl-D-alanine carboxypeptidase